MREPLQDIRSFCSLHSLQASKPRLAYPATPASRFRKPCRSRFSSHSPATQIHRQTAQTCFEGPFGEVLRATGPACGTNPFRISTKYQDDETDLLYYGYRYYNAIMGRWISRDPIGEHGGKNVYCIVRNRSTTLVDRLGLHSVINNCCANGRTTVQGVPDGDSVVVKETYPRVAVHLSLKIILIGSEDDSETNIPTNIEGWVPMDGGEAPRTLCAFKYKCSQKCKCLGGALTVTKEWAGGRDLMYGRVFSHMIMTPWGKPQLGADGKPLYTGATCEVWLEEEARAVEDCRKTSEGKCDQINVTIQTGK